ncbi:MAG: peptidoglycan bridge formation glycyltransferase FemA/FemB family protein [Candidatus Portnoybacteria bacterium]|nr:peptidoglycan bridge formation glycyltransferase FemA/FemB family protein [Candidatus Portnoybacteria bacterium]
MFKSGLNETEKTEWNRFVIGQGGNFLQSWQWGEFQKSLGKNVFYLKNNDWQALAIKHDLPLGRNYLYSPRVQLRLPGGKSSIEEIINLTRKEKSIFLRIEPVGTNEDELKEIGFVKTKDIQPGKTLVLDLGVTKEELFLKMHEKTRYNIGLAERKGVKIRKAKYNENDFEIFWKIMNLTAKRQGIRIFSKEYYRKEIQINDGDFKNFLFIAEFDGKPIAVNLLNIFGKTATYLHGGSDNKYRSFMAPHLLQWEQIKEAKTQGCQIYDFWGYDEQKWPGVSRFKRGFGGREVVYPGCFDYPIDKKWFSIYKIARKIM